MKKLKLKEWVKAVLIFVMVLSIMIVGGECDSFIVLIVKGVLGVYVFERCWYLLVTYH